jgi:hypothetical protein
MRPSCVVALSGSIRRAIACALMEILAVRWLSFLAVAGDACLKNFITSTYALILLSWLIIYIHTFSLQIHVSLCTFVCPRDVLWFEILKSSPVLWFEILKSTYYRSRRHRVSHLWMLRSFFPGYRVLVVRPTCALFVWLISHQLTALFSRNESAPAVSHQPNEQAIKSFDLKIVGPAWIVWSRTNLRWVVLLRSWRY